jgi:hypothetical protein
MLKDIASLFVGKEWFYKKLDNYINAILNW